MKPRVGILVGGGDQNLVPLCIPTLHQCTFPFPQRALGRSLLWPCFRCQGAFLNRTSRGNRDWQTHFEECWLKGLEDGMTLERGEWN